MIDLNNYLLKEGLNELSEEFSELIINEILTWKIEAAENCNHTDCIIGLSFGFVLDRNGSKKPGKINRKLGGTLLKYYQAKPRHVFAQWEIGEALKGKIPSKDLTIIYPEKDPNTKQDRYLSTKSVLEIVKGYRAEYLGTALIIAHQDHLVRCVKIAAHLGFKALCNQEDMPNDYDEQSGQYWTSNRKLYLISDMISRLAFYREVNFEKQK